MPNRVSKAGELKEGPIEPDNHHPVCQFGVRQAPPSATILMAAIDRLIADNRACGGAEIEFFGDLASGELRPEIQTVVFPIVQELLLNACRHSKSKNVSVGLAQDDERVCIQVQDWGIGFDSQMVQPQRCCQAGLNGIRQVAQWLGGTVDVDSRPGAGTCIVVEIPLVQETGPRDQTGECRSRRRP
jgi:signal transduction histidine kinase